ncbi:uncharacterized protein [Argopecten irradians]|uniref:uncharacterized protein n=1 Tax=Argopecten irradians TaxID=31199 RepID=UPI003714A8BF
MIWSGEKRGEIYTTWTLTVEEKKSFTTLTGIFETHVRPKTNKISSRYKFQCRTQQEGETFEQFLTDLHVLARDFAYQEKDSMIRDAIVFGTVDHKVREKCINEGSELTLDAAVNYARTYELFKAQLQKMVKTVNIIKKAHATITSSSFKRVHNVSLSDYEGYVLAVEKNVYNRIECSSKCQTDCLSYSYNKETKECKTYTKALCDGNSVNLSSVIQMYTKKSDDSACSAIHYMPIRKEEEGEKGE